MIRQKEGPAIHQDIRANSNPARSRKTRPSVAEKRADDRAALSLLQAAGSALVGAAFLLAFMWLAAAY